MAGLRPFRQIPQTLIEWSRWMSGALDHIKHGSGIPEASVTGNVGDLYLRTDGGTNTTLYIKESGTGKTGWIAK